MTNFFTIFFPFKEIMKNYNEDITSHTSLELVSTRKGVRYLISALSHIFPLNYIKTGKLCPRKYVTVKRKWILKFQL